MSFLSVQLSFNIFRVRVHDLIDNLFTCSVRSTYFYLCLSLSLNQCVNSFMKTIKMPYFWVNVIFSVANATFFSGSDGKWYVYLWRRLHCLTVGSCDQCHSFNSCIQNHDNFGQMLHFHNLHHHSVVTFTTENATFAQNCHGFVCRSQNYGSNWNISRGFPLYNYYF